MRVIFRLFWDLCLFRKAPQDIPFSGFLFFITLFINVLLEMVELSFLTNEATRPGPGAGILYIIVSTIVYLLLIYSVMMLLGFKKRVLQTLTALQGGDMIFNSLLMTVGMLLLALPKAAPLLYLTLMFMLGWALAVHANIFRHALSISIFTAGFLAVGLFFLQILIREVFLPVVM